MSGEIFRQFSPIELFRLILHGLFAIAPLLLFPKLAEEFNLNIYVLVAVTFVIGLLLYSIPCDLFFPNYKKIYKNGFNKFIEQMCGYDIKDIEEKVRVRSLYDIIFYKYYPENIRVRIHFLVSLYYFYSRTFFIGIIYILAATSGFAILLKFKYSINESIITNYVIHPLGNLVGMYDDPCFSAKMVIILVVGIIIALSSFKYSQKLLLDIVDFEKASFLTYLPEFKRLIKKVRENINTSSDKDKKVRIIEITKT